MKEIWKDIYFVEKGVIYDYRGLYQVSNTGKVKSLLNNKMLLPINNGNNYLKVTLWKNKKGKKFYIHRLTANAFLPNLENKPFINHLDCNPLNNSIDNLEWCTPQENTDYMAKLGRNKRTEIWNNRRNKSNEKYKKPVVRIDKKTGEITRYEFLNQVINDGFRAGDICKCCKGQRKSAGGYYWRYL